MLISEKFITIQSWLNNYLQERLSTDIQVELDFENKNWFLYIKNNIIRFPITETYYSPGQMLNCSRISDKYSYQNQIVQLFS